MKRFWVCQCEVTPGKGVETFRFPTLEEGKRAMRQKLAQHVDLTEYLEDLQPEAAQFLKNYLSDPDFPRTQEECPNLFEDLEDQDGDICGEMLLDSGYVYLKCWYGLEPQLNTNLVLDEAEDEEYFLDFWYDGLWRKTHNGISGMSIQIRRGIDYGTSAYLLLVLLALRKEPATQGALIRKIADQWNTYVDRKTVGRHLKLLKDMGYPVQRNEEGYYYEGETTAPVPDMEFTPNTYPLMVLEVLDSVPQTIESMVQRIHSKYGVKVERKAVSRHLELLRELGLSGARTKGGYYRL